MIKEDAKVAVTTIDAPMLAKMFLAGAKNLEAKKEWINELNVFPVPDGDTGTNMTMTIMSAAAEVSSLGFSGEGGILWLSARGAGQFGRYIVAVVPWIYQRDWQI